MSVSVVIPCLNEAGSIQECVSKVREAFRGELKLEVLVVDNGSSDGSPQLAEQAGARVIQEKRRGYGSAILKGLSEANGDYIVVGDADNTYDFEDGSKLVEQLKNGAEFAIGDRIHGQIDEGAMPWLHQHFGTPVLTWVLNCFFGSRVHDINCGLRAIRKDCVDRLKLRSPGMEFASEMVIHAQKAGLRFAEVPIRYYKRHHGQAKLRTFRDGWRHLRFILLCAPFALFLIPSFAGIGVSIFLYSIPRFGFQVLGSVFLMLSFEILIFGILAKAFLWVMDSFIVDQRFGRGIENFQLEYGLLASLLLCLAGVIFLQQIDLANLIRGTTLLILSVQTFFSSFLLSTILFKRVWSR